MRTSTFVLLFALCAAQACFAETPAGGIEIHDDVLIRTPEGATLSATVALPRNITARLPTLLILEIYTNTEDARKQATEFAERGYVGVMADVRGKRLSPDDAEPYEHEAVDSYAVIDWIARQPWSNGKVGMLGSSYSGFTAWAATKHLHPALKTIATSAAGIPGQGLPMYNNVFLNANYKWAFYVTNNKLLDDKVNSDGNRWRTLNRTWFFSGKPYRQIDAVDGTPNPFLKRWLSHPAYDAYWQSMVPYKREFAKIGIPVLSITGYYDDAQISVLQYFKEHTARRKNAEHYLVIGPYDHAGSNASVKPTELRDYTIDPVAQLDTQELKLAWMDHVLRGAPKPTILKDRINYEVMGANEWRGAKSLEKMRGKLLRLYFSDTRTADGLYALTAKPPQQDGFVEHKVDFANRNIFHGYHAYPNPIVQTPLQYVTETIYESEPLPDGTVISGSFSGEIVATINKRDFDLSVTVYEAMEDGKLFHLGYALQRASFAREPSQRQLLTPGKPERIAFETTMVSRKLAPGSRLLVLLDAVKTPNSQVNYGTGKDVSDEGLDDAGEPLTIRWTGQSSLNVSIE